MSRTTMLLLLLLLAANSAVPRAAAYQIETPQDYLNAWGKSTSDDINPCLVGTIMPPPSTTNGQPTTYPPGQDKTWVAGSKSLAKYLSLNKDLGQGNSLIRAMALAVGFFPSYTWVNATTPMQVDTPAYYQGTWQLIVFDGCQKKAGSGEAPTVAYWLNRAIYVYGIDIPLQTYTTLVTQYWNLSSYTGCVDVYCPASSGFYAGTTTCGCDASYMAAVSALSPLMPTYYAELKKQNTSTALCMAGLRKLQPTPQAVRVALNVCFGASTWNTGIGVSWDGTSTALPAGLTYPEFVLENTAIKVLRAVRVPMGDYK